MDLFNDWTNKLQPIIQLYKDRKHPLEYTNLYELVIMVILSAVAHIIDLLSPLMGT